MSTTKRFFITILFVQSGMAYSMFGPAIQYNFPGFGKESVEYRTGKSGNIYGRRDTFMKTSYSSETTDGTQAVVTYYKVGSKKGTVVLEKVEAVKRGNKERVHEKIKEVGGLAAFYEALRNKFHSLPSSNSAE